jgi:Ca2+-binding RTX toxin-like protein
MFTEALETRRMFAVTASLTSGNLLVRGDAANNDILVRRNPSAAEYVVTERGAFVARFADARGVTRLTLDGGAGNDKLQVASAGTSAVYLPADLFGGDGNDVFRGGGYKNWFFGGPGNDTADYSDRTTDLNITLDNVANDRATASATDFDNVRDDVECVTGGSGADILVGSNATNVLSGRAGNDEIFGLGGNDRIYGESGNDHLCGDSGADLVSGGPGNDFVSGHRFLPGTGVTVWDHQPDNLIGGTGHDLLVGFGGRDTYVSNDDGDEKDLLYVVVGNLAGVTDIFHIGENDVLRDL